MTRPSSSGLWSQYQLPAQPLQSGPTTVPSVGPSAGACFLPQHQGPLARTSGRPTETVTRPAATTAPKPPTPATSHPRVCLEFTTFLQIILPTRTRPPAKNHKTIGFFNIGK